MPHTFIILEPDPIVSMDLEGMLQSRYPGCHVATGLTLLDIGAPLNNCGPGTVLFIRSTLMEDNDSIQRVLTVTATRGAHIVVLGQVVKTEFPATFVDLPFTTDMVFQAVEPETVPPAVGPYS